jgi:hypothetical protein
MEWNKHTANAFRKISGGIKSILSGIFGLVKTTDKMRLDFRFLCEARDWDLNFGPVYGEAGTTTVITAAPQCLFRGEKVVATDTANKPGCGTRISQVLIGQRLQRPATGGGSLTVFFSNGAVGNGTQWDICESSQSISVTVSFIESCTFDMTVFGSAIL